MGVVQPHDGLVQPHGGVVQPHDGLVQPHGGLVQPHDGLVQPHDGLVQPRDGLVQPHDGLVQSPTFRSLQGRPAHTDLLCSDHLKGVEYVLYGHQDVDWCGRGRPDWGPCVSGGTGVTGQRWLLLAGLITNAGAHVLTPPR